MKSFTIVGYTYDADILCDDCTRTIAIRESLKAGMATVWGDSGSAEDILGEWALAIGLDKDDERSYDSSEFPKVIFADQAHDGCYPDNGYSRGQCGDRCAHCHNPIGFDCPNIDED